MLNQEEKFKKVAIDLAMKAGEIMRKNFSLGMKTRLKKDKTFLTITDEKINQLVIETVKKKFSDHSVLAEEGSFMQKGAQYVWVCDPVDGTLPFSHGLPTFAFSLALVKNGESILGVVYDPILKRLFVAQKEKGATLNGKKIVISMQNKKKKWLINNDARNRFPSLEKNLKKRYFTLTIGSAVYSSMLVALGEFAGEIFGFKNPWDGAAVKIIVEEAGGKVTDISGKDQRYDRPINGFIASNGIIHDDLIKMVKFHKK